MEATFKLARIRGIDVGIHFSWFIVVVLFTVIFAQSQYRRPIRTGRKRSTGR
ncbi:MAG: hypothetical protein R2849_20550 [Thermomicrobiales bacterium]